MCEAKKIENWNNWYIAQFIDTKHCQVFPLSYTRKLFALNSVLTHSLNFFIVTKRILDWHHFSSESFCSQSCAGGSFCWNYGTHTFYGNYAGHNNCCIYSGFEVVLSVTGMLVDLSIAFMLVAVSPANMWVTIFIVIMQMGVCVPIMQVVFFTGLCTWQFLL